MIFIEIMGLIGTGAFAVSGVLVGMKNKLDLFGLFVLAVITASGGGLIRDVIISDDMPVFFTNPQYLITIVIAMIITCLTVKYINRMLYIIKFFDAVGLGVFTIIATYRCMLLNMPFIGVMFIACLTGIGGGIVRDILVNDVPLVFKSEIYALASMIGAMVFYFLYNIVEPSLNVYICVFIVFIIRMAAVHYNIKLPVINVKDEK